jgi:hypothetical protein
LKVCTLTNLKRLITKSHAFLLSVFKHIGKQQKKLRKEKEKNQENNKKKENIPLTNTYCIGAMKKRECLGK